MAAAGRDGKYLDLEGSRFGEMVSKDIEEEMQKFARHGFGAPEIIFNPARDWATRGLLSSQMRRSVARAIVDVRVGRPADCRETPARIEPLRRPLGQALIGPDPIGRHH